MNGVKRRFHVAVLVAFRAECCYDERIRKSFKEKDMNVPKTVLHGLFAAFILLLAACESFQSTPAAAMPSITPPQGTYPTAIVVARLSCTTAGAVIHFTVDGKAPTIDSPVYAGEGISLAESVTVQAIAVAGDMRASKVLKATYTMTDLGGTVRGGFFSDGARTVPLTGVPANRFVIAQIQNVDAAGGTSWYDKSKAIFYYDKETGSYALTGLPPDQGLWILAYVKNTSGAAGAHPGDLFVNHWESFSDMSAKGRTGVDLNLLGIMHMTAPIDNAAATPTLDPDKDSWSVQSSPVRFAWDAYPGAAYYKFWLMEWNRGWKLVREVANGVRTTETGATYKLAPVQNPGGYYSFNILAYDSKDTALALDIYSQANGYPNQNNAFVIK
jgi:hypothetical protein